MVPTFADDQHRPQLPKPKLAFSTERPRSSDETSTRRYHGDAPRFSRSRDSSPLAVRSTIIVPSRTENTRGAGWSHSSSRNSPLVRSSLPPPPRRPWPPFPLAEDEEVSLAREVNPSSFAVDADQHDTCSRGTLDQQPIILDVKVRSCDSAQTTRMANLEDTQYPLTFAVATGDHSSRSTSHTTGRTNVFKSRMKLSLSEQDLSLSDRRAPSPYTFTPKADSKTTLGSSDSGYFSLFDSKQDISLHPSIAERTLEENAFSDALRGKGRTRDVVSKNSGSTGFSQKERFVNHTTYNNQNTTDIDLSAYIEETAKPGTVKDRAEDSNTMLSDTMYASGISKETKRSSRLEHGLELFERNLSPITLSLDTVGKSQAEGPSSIASPADLQTPTFRPVGYVGNSHYAKRSPSQYDNSMKKNSSANHLSPSIVVATEMTNVGASPKACGPVLHRPEDRTRVSNSEASTSPEPSDEPRQGMLSNIINNHKRDFNRLVPLAELRESRSASALYLPYPVDDPTLMPDEQRHRPSFNATSGRSSRSDKLDPATQPNTTGVRENCGDMQAITCQAESSHGTLHSRDEDFNLSLCLQCWEHYFKHSHLGRQLKFIRHEEHRPIDRCAMGSPWMQMAWDHALGTHRSAQQVLIEQARVCSEQVPCPGRHRDIRNWMAVVMDDGQLIEGFDICPCDAKRIETLMPLLRGLFRINPDRKDNKRRCDFRTSSARFIKYMHVLMAIETAAFFGTETQVARVDDFINLVQLKANTQECPRDNIVYGRRWHLMAQLPEFSICEDCYTEEVWPAIEYGWPLAMCVNQTPQHIRRGFSASGKRNRALVNGVSCQLYSSRMRRIWSDALKNNDLSYLRRKVLERMRVEIETHERMASIRQSMSELDTSSSDFRLLEGRLLSDMEKVKVMWERRE